MTDLDFSPGSLWRKRSTGKVVRVLSSSPKSKRVVYETVLGGRVWSTWFDRFLKEFEPDHPTHMAEILRNLRVSAAAGNPRVVMPYEARALLDGVESLHSDIESTGRKLAESASLVTSLRAQVERLAALSGPQPALPDLGPGTHVQTLRATFAAHLGLPRDATSDQIVSTLTATLSHAHPTC